MAKNLPGGTAVRDDHGELFTIVRLSESTPDSYVVSRSGGKNTYRRFTELSLLDPTPNAAVAAAAAAAQLQLHPNLASPQVLLKEIAGTHGSVGRVFDDGRAVSATAAAIRQDPALLRSERMFRLTVFRASVVSDGGGRAEVWSMNNRRLAAMQAAGLPEDTRIDVTWASDADILHALRPGAFGNLGRAVVGFHEVASRTVRTAAVTHMHETAVGAGDRALIDSGRATDADFARMFDL